MGHEATGAGRCWCGKAASELTPGCCSLLHAEFPPRAQKTTAEVLAESMAIAAALAAESENTRRPGLLERAFAWLRAAVRR